MLLVCELLQEVHNFPGSIKSSVTQIPLSNILVREGRTAAGLEQRRELSPTPGAPEQMGLRPALGPDTCRAAQPPRVVGPCASQSHIRGQAHPNPRWSAKLIPLPSSPSSPPASSSASTFCCFASNRFSLVDFDSGQTPRQRMSVFAADIQQQGEVFKHLKER